MIKQPYIPSPVNRERQRVLARILQNRAYATYHENLHYSLSLRVKERLSELQSVTV